jgi:hypothetical protein
VRVSVVAKPAFAAADLQQIERQARAKVPGDMQVSVAVVKQLETNRSGKAPFVLRRIDRDTRQRLQG